MFSKKNIIYNTIEILNQINIIILFILIFSTVV